MSLIQFILSEKLKTVLNLSCPVILFGFLLCLLSCQTNESNKNEYSSIEEITGASIFTVSKSNEYIKSNHIDSGLNESDWNIYKYNWQEGMVAGFKSKVSKIKVLNIPSPPKLRKEFLNNLTIKEYGTTRGYFRGIYQSYGYSDKYSTEYIQGWLEGTAITKDFESFDNLEFDKAPKPINKKQEKYSVGYLFGQSKYSIQEDYFASTLERFDMEDNRIIVSNEFLSSNNQDTGISAQEWNAYKDGWKIGVVSGYKAKNSNLKKFIIPAPPKKGKSLKNKSIEDLKRIGKMKGFFRGAYNRKEYTQSYPGEYIQGWIEGLLANSKDLNSVVIKNALKPIDAKKDAFQDGVSRAKNANSVN